MSHRRCPTRWLLVCAFLLNAGVAAAADKAKLMLSIDTPEPGAVVGDPAGMAFVSGKALALFGDLQTFDIMFVIDASESTAAPSGADVDGDGKIGQKRGAKYLKILADILPLPNSDHGDSVLAAEISAVRVLLDQLDPRTTRVGIVVFSGDRDSLTPDAYTQVPLTSDYQKVNRGLDDILDVGPGGMTNMVSAINLATVELFGMRSAFSEKREGSRRIIIFLTDGQPTLPMPNSRLANTRMAINKAVRAGKLGIRIDTYAIGKDALREPVVVVEMARVTLGVFTPILHPKDLQAVFEDVTFADIETLEVRNKTTNSPAEYQIQNPDGSFSALIPMKEGKNRVEVFARSTDGSEARRHVDLTFLPEAGMPRLDPRHRAQRNRLLENRLLDLQRKNVKIQIERDEDVRRKLEIEIDEEREKAEARSADMRRKLELEVEEEN